MGFTWGDGDYFHWVDDEGNSLFNVSTSTPRGYFLPEQAIAGKLHVEDLTFAIRIAETRNPDAVLDSMIRAAKYAQARLGGSLGGPDGPALDAAKLRASLQQVVAKMSAVGVAPGSKDLNVLFQ